MARRAGGGRGRTDFAGRGDRGLGSPNVTVATPDRPLRALWQRHRAYRGRFVLAVAMSTLNKVADVVPELLIGAAVDVVVRGDDSLVGEVLGVDSRYAQLAWLAAINVVVWIVESASEYVADVLWRGLAQGVEHDLRVEAYDHVQHLDLSLARGALQRLDAGHPQRRRQPARALPRRRGAGDPADRAQRAPGRRRLRRVLVDPAGARVPADPADRHRLAGLPAPARAALRPGPRRGRATSPAPCPPTSPGITTIKAFTAEDRERDRIADGLAAYRARQHRRHPLLGRVRAAGADGDPRRASPAPCCSAAG